MKNYIRNSVLIFQQQGSRILDTHPLKTNQSYWYQFEGAGSCPLYGRRKQRKNKITVNTKQGLKQQVN